MSALADSLSVADKVGNWVAMETPCQVSTLEGGGGVPAVYQGEAVSCSGFSILSSGFVSGLHTGLHGLFCQAAHRKSRRTHPRRASLQRGGLRNTTAGYHGNKGEEDGCDLVSVHATLYHVLWENLCDTVGIH